MIWRHLFEEEISSPSFVQAQLRFESNIYGKIAECQKKEIVESHRFSSCAEKWEQRIDKFGLLLQYLVSDREKMLQVELLGCKEGDITACMNKKQRNFIKKYYQQDLKFLQLAREELLH